MCCKGNEVCSIMVFAIERVSAIAIIRYVNGFSSLHFLNILLKSTKLDYILYIIVTSGVLMAELANTAIEHVANAISGEYNEEIRLAKDIGSGIVLMQGFAFFIVEGIVFITKFV